MALGYDLDENPHAIKVVKREPDRPYTSFADVREAAQSGEREARVFSENVEKAKADEARRRQGAREQDAEQRIAACAAAGIYLSNADIERIRADAAK